MANSALYFPYIDVPQTQWLFRVLLYWDTIKSIVPIDYVNAPEQHSAEMRELLAAGLVEPVMPSEYISDIDRFGDGFLSFVEHRQRGLRRLKAGKPGKHEEGAMLLHVEKLGRVGDALVDRSLAERAGYPWFRVQRWVAVSFMAYLAAVLGQQHGVEADPVTFDRSSLFVLGGSPSKLVHARRSRARTLMLRSLLPRPKANLDLHSIVRFKERHTDALRRFRSAVELECIALAQIDDAASRHERALLVSDVLRNEIEDLSEAMRLQWGRTVLGGLAAVLGDSLALALAPQSPAGVRVGASLSLAATVCQSLVALQERRRTLSKPMAYGALVSRTFGSH